jgi:hypothetical protein
VSDYGEVTAIAVDKGDSVFVTGSSFGSSGYECVTIKYSSSALKAAIHVAPSARFPGAKYLTVIAANNDSACVTLSGSATDADLDSLTYQWSNAERFLPFASGETVLDCLDVGPHTLRLDVSGRGSAGSATVTVQVISLCTAVDLVIDEVANSNLTARRKQPLLVSLEAAWESFDRGDLAAGRGELNAFEQKVQAQLRKSEPAVAQKLGESAQAILSALGQH